MEEVSPSKVVVLRMRMPAIVRCSTGVKYTRCTTEISDLDVLQLYATLS